MKHRTQNKSDIGCTDSRTASGAYYSTPQKADTTTSFHNNNKAAKRFSVLATMMLGFIGLASAPSMAQAEILNTSAFEWSMPDRLLENKTIAGYDPASPIPEYDPNAEMLPTNGWKVNFDACGVTTSTVSAYEWSVDGVAVGTGVDCHFSHQFPKEGVYQISLNLTDEVGDTALIEQEITVQDWLIIALGESYASGEGNPEKPVTAQAQIDFHILTELVENIAADLQTARNLLPGKKEAEQAALQLKNNAKATLDQAITDLTRLKQDAAEMLEIDTNVENDPTVVAARNNVATKKTNLANKQTAYDSALSAYNNCEIRVIPPIETCLDESGNLAAAKLLLEDAELALSLAETALVTARNAAIVIYSASATIGSFTLHDAFILAYDTKIAAVNGAENARNTAQDAFNSAESAWQQTIEAVASLESLITDTQAAWQQAKTEAMTQYLNHLPQWTSTAPSWGTPEPDYADIILNGAVPGDALRCHRSMISGQARAALAIEKADPHTSVTLVHLACSGAIIKNLIQDPDPGYKEITADNHGVLDPLLALSNNITIPAQQEIKGQIVAAAEKTLNREVDAVVISIGGNDLGFSDLIIDCILAEPCHLDDKTLESQEYLEAQQLAAEQNCSPGAFINYLTGAFLPTGQVSFTDACLDAYVKLQNASPAAPGDAKKTFDAKLPVLNGKWTDLDAKLNEQFPALDDQRVYLTDYLAPTGDDFGNYCGWDPMQTTTLGEELKNLPGFSQPEMIWADTEVAAGLRHSIQMATTQFQWSFIQETGMNGETIATASRNHGYCADDNWLVTIPESLITQQDTHGIMHPNRKGHAIYEQAIFTQLMADFYPNGVDQSPRSPGVPSPNIEQNTGVGSNLFGTSGGGGSTNPLLLISMMGALIYLRQRHRKI